MQRYRQAMEQDIEAILAMMRQYYAEDGYPLLEPEARAALRDLTRDERLGCVWVAELHGRVVGYLAVTFGFSFEYRGRDAFVDELFIREEARGRGLGREALEIAEAFCRAHGVKALHLEVERHREHAVELYRVTGFENHERYLMTKRLDGSNP